MRKTLGPLRSKVFSNPFVTAAGKRLLFEQRVLPKFLYGAGLWRLSTLHEEQAALEPVRMAMRGSFRALTGYSCKALSAKEIAAVLDLPTAQKALGNRANQGVARGCTGPGSCPGPLSARTDIGSHKWVWI